MECYNILAKIRQVDELMTPALQERVREGHPEVVFAELRGQQYGLALPKRSLEGERERLELLAGHWGEHVQELQAAARK